MIKNFEEIKTQLKELSEIVNSFESEAVQLRIVELVFGLETEQEQKGTAGDDAETVVKNRKAPRKKAATKANNGDKPKKSGNKPSGQGAVATLGKLVEEGFFNQPKSIGDIVEHCDHNLARKFKANEFSGKLSRLVRDGSLTRTKNADSQYEYQSK